MAAKMFDLVEYQGRPYTVCGSDADGQLKLTGDSWPIEFGELEDFVAPAEVLADPAAVAVVTPGVERLLEVAYLLKAIDDAAEVSNSYDWNDVDQALFRAAKAFPAQLLSVDVEASRWKIAEEVPDEMLVLANPAAMLIATHVIGAGEGNLSDIASAISFANKAINAHGTPSPVAPPSI